MTTQIKFRYSIVVSFRIDGDVEDMVFGDQKTLETFSLDDISKCPKFVIERVVWLKLIPDGHPIKEGDRVLGLRIDERNSHIYLDQNEKIRLFKHIRKNTPQNDYT